MKKVWWVGLVLVLAAVLLSACGPKKVTLNMDMKEYEFIPNTLEVPAGAEVTVNLKNIGTLEHEMVIMVYGKQATPPFDDDDEPNIYWEHELEAGEDAVVTFTAPSEKGEYQIVCGVPSHLEQGMVGELIVK